MEVPLLALRGNKSSFGYLCVLCDVFEEKERRSSSDKKYHFNDMRMIHSYGNCNYYNYLMTISANNNSIGNVDLRECFGYSRVFRLITKRVVQKF